MKKVLVKLIKFWNFFSDDFQTFLFDFEQNFLILVILLQFNSGVEINTPCGFIIGKSIDGIDHFEGIPFAYASRFQHS